MKPALSLERVTKRYRTVTAVDALSLQVERGEIYALLGPNGAGKTTTVRMIQGILAPDEGRIGFGFEGARGWQRPGLGYLPEDRGLYREQPIGRTLEFFGRLRGLSKSDARREAGVWLERFDLAERKNDKLDSLSKGNQQKVQLASALLHRPALCILDEPFSGLDPINQDVLLALLQELREEGMTLLLSAHQMDLVERCADRLMILCAGRAHLEGTVDELRRRGRSTARIRCRLDEGSAPPAAEGAPIEVVAQAEGWWEVRALEGGALAELLAFVSTWSDLREVVTEQERLHDVYVQVVAEAAASSRGAQESEETAV